MLLVLSEKGAVVNDIMVAGGGGCLWLRIFVKFIYCKCVILDLVTESGML